MKNPVSERRLRTNHAQEDMRVEDAAQTDIHAPGPAATVDENSGLGRRPARAAIFKSAAPALRTSDQSWQFLVSTARIVEQRARWQNAGRVWR
jgi:hypothetical protein